jgi:hypothetical protein
LSLAVTSIATQSSLYLLKISERARSSVSPCSPVGGVVAFVLRRIYPFTPCLGPL